MLGFEHHVKLVAQRFYQITSGCELLGIFGHAVVPGVINIFGTDAHDDGFVFVFFQLCSLIHSERQLIVSTIEGKSAVFCHQTAIHHVYGGTADETGNKYVCGIVVYV